jgi:phosphatidylglycerophosphate synthase
MKKIIIKNIINILSTFRIKSTSNFIYKTLLKFIFCKERILTVFFVDILSDLLDGFFSKKTYRESISGSLIDPLFDKTLFYKVKSFFVYKGMFTWKYIDNTSIIRDIYLTLKRFASLKLDLETRINSVLIGKIKTMLQFCWLFNFLQTIGLSKLYRLNLYYLFIYKTTRTLNLMSVIKYH